MPDEIPASFTPDPVASVPDIYGNPPESTPAPVAAVAPEPQVSAPAAPEPAAVEPGTQPATTPAPPVVEAPVAPDYGAWLTEKFKADEAAVAAALAAAPRVSELEQQVAQTENLRALLADPVKAREFVELTSADFTKLAESDPKQVLYAQYKTQNAGKSEEVNKLRFEREFAAKYPGLSYDDPDSDTHREDALLLADDSAAAAQFMTAKQAEAKAQLEAKPVEAQPSQTPEQIQAAADAHLQTVNSFFEGLEGFDFEVEGQKVSMPITNQEAIKQATINFGDFIRDLVTTDGQYDVNKAALAAYKLTEDIATHAAKAAKGAQGPLVPMNTLVNNPTGSAAPVQGDDRAGFLAALRNASTGNAQPDIYR